MSKKQQTNEENTQANRRGLLQMLASVSAIQVVGFLLLPLLGRLYTKADYGILGTLMGFVGLLTLVVNGRYDQAALIAPRGSRLDLLRALGVSINLLLTILVCIVCFVAPLWLRGSGYEHIIPYLFIIPITSSLAGLVSMFAAQANARAHYGSISLSQFFQGLVNNLLKVLCGFLGLGAWGFAIAYNASQSVAVGVLRSGLPRLSLRSISLYRLRVVAYHYRAFPLFTIGQVWIDMFVAQLLPLALPRHYRVEEIGLLTMLFMITRRPVQLLSEATSRVYARRLVAAREQGRRYVPIFLRMLARLSVLACILLCVMPWVAQGLIAFVLGEQWLELAPLVIGMIPYLLVQSAIYIFGFIPDVLGRQHSYLYVQLARLMCELGSVLLLPLYMGFNRFMLTYYALEAIALSGILFWFYTLLRSHDRAKPEG